MNFSFVQITDHHIRESESNLLRGLDTAYTLRAVLRHIARNVGERIDFIVSTGDVSDYGVEFSESTNAAAYQTFCRITNLSTPSPAPGPQLLTAEGLRDVPIYFLPGNHDDRDLFFRYLSPQTPPMPLMNLAFEHKGIQFVCLDQGTAAKAVAYPQTLDFLARSLESGKPTVVLTHHHLIPVGSRMLDNFIADDVKEFWRLVRGQNVLAIIFGHVHNTYEGLVEGIPELGLRATSFQFALLPKPLIALQSPHYRLVTIQDGILTSRVFEVPV